MYVRVFRHRPCVFFKLDTLNRLLGLAAQQKLAPTDAEYAARVQQVNNVYATHRGAGAGAGGGGDADAGGGGDADAGGGGDADAGAGGGVGAGAGAGGLRRCGRRRFAQACAQVSHEAAGDAQGELGSKDRSNRFEGGLRIRRHIMYT